MEPRPDTTSASGSTSDMPRLPAEGHSYLALSSSGCICSPWPSPPSSLYPSAVSRDFSLPVLWSGLPWELTWVPIIRPPLVTVKRSQVPAHVSFTIQTLSVWHLPFSFHSRDGSPMQWSGKWDRGRVPKPWPNWMDLFQACSILYHRNTEIICWQVDWLFTLCRVSQPLIYTPYFTGDKM